MNTNMLNAMASLIGGLREGMETSRARKTEDEEQATKRQYMQSLIEQSQRGHMLKMPSDLGAGELEAGGFAPGTQIRSSLAPALMNRMSAMGRTQMSKRTKDDILKQFNVVNKEITKLSVEKAKLEASYERNFVDEDVYAEKLTGIEAHIDFNKRMLDNLRTKASTSGINLPEVSLTDEIEDVWQEDTVPVEGGDFGSNVGEYMGELKDKFTAPVDYFKNLFNQRGVGGGY